MAEVFTGSPGKYVGLAETIRGFQLILSGELDGLPEQAFYLVGNIDEASTKAITLEEENKSRGREPSSSYSPLYSWSTGWPIPSN